MPVGEVAGIIQRSNQEIVVSMAEEDQKALHSRQLSTKSVSCPAFPSQSLGHVVSNDQSLSMIKAFR